MAGELNTAPQPESWTQLEQWVSVTTIARIFEIDPHAGKILAGVIDGEPEILEAIAGAIGSWKEDYAVEALAGVVEEAVRKFAGLRVLPA
jgi:hypothetical protein